MLKNYNRFKLKKMRGPETTLELLNVLYDLAMEGHVESTLEKEIEKVLAKKEAPEPENKLLNLYVQDEKALKNLIGVYLEDEATFNENAGHDIGRKIPVHTSQGDYDANYLLWDAYIVDLSGSNGLVLVKKERV